MKVINCPKCGRVFKQITSPVCPKCEKADEENFQKVRQHIEEDPLCNIRELAEATEVPVKRILQYIREGRLEVSHGLAEDVRCVKCGDNIEKGNFCEKCSLEIAKELQSTHIGNQKKQLRMHTSGRR